MKKLMVISCVIVFFFGITGIANATLCDRGGGLIYDDVLDITWLQDANYAQTSGYDSDGRMWWDTAMSWAETLSYYDSVRNVYYDDWRLPDAHNQDGSGPYVGFNVTNSEMGHMFYNNLGGSPGGSMGSFPGMDFTDGVTGETRSFQNLQAFGYFAGTEHASNPDWAWDFNFYDGYQNAGIKDNLLYAWAVRDGDVAPIPEPATMLLLGSGLIGLAGFRRRLKRSS